MAEFYLILRLQNGEGRMFNPTATYRIQFHKGFTFSHFEKIIPYLEQLGVSTIYASPIFKAVPGSNHGYDVTDPHQINPEIGTLAQFRRISKKLKDLNMGWLQDIVPNHMAFHPDNQWLWDVLEKGNTSRYTTYFDILRDDKLMVPFLGKSLEEVIDNKELQFVKKHNKSFLRYGGMDYPIAKNTFKKGDSVAEIAARQHYVLCDWKESNRRMNYRRFFTVNGLICLNMQDKAVFDHYHQFIHELLSEGLIQGLRVDHIDGLFDPKAYLERLRQLAGPDCYIVVEKILEAGESFPADWPVQGNTGYDFLAQVNNLLTAQESKVAFTQFYKEFTGHTQTVKTAIPQKKAAILRDSMGGELENLYQLAVSKLSTKPGKDLKTVIGNFLVRCPVYRFYAPDRNAIGEALTNITGNSKAVSQLKKLLLTDSHFFHRCMQFSGPLMAKGVEDTLMYTYDRFIGHNEVGDSPDLFGLEAGQFHRQMIDRQKKLPLSLNATSTHDTKRGEDVRARLNVLTDRAEEWIRLVPKWQKMNRDLKTGEAPDVNDEYLVYQTLSGFYPFAGQQEDDLPGRLKAYLVKALREAKVHSGWAEPDEAYEAATIDFALKLLTPDTRFHKSFLAWQEHLAQQAVLNSLVQTILKFTCPGIPDVYQGCEGWDLSLVDPDNRRPVDFELRKRFLEHPEPQNHYSGNVKTNLTASLFQLRKQYSEPFSFGDYLPLRVKGKHKAQVLAFARKAKRQWAVVIVPLHLGRISEQPFAVDWENTAVVLPEDAPLQWYDQLNQKEQLADGQIRLSVIFEKQPFAILISQMKEQFRGAGIILPVSALPSPYAIGDMGPQARKFVDFLSQATQKYWQLLPLNPVSAAFGFSPYSASSSLAGNTLLISPDDLAADGLLAARELAQNQGFTNRVKYPLAERQKEKLFQKAWQRFRQGPANPAFETFKQTEAYWLNNYALYFSLKSHYQKPWYDWPKVFREREPTALLHFSEKHSDAMERCKWLQYLFLKQWTALKQYANEQGISLIGDLPFYISFDSADVWARPRVFKLDKRQRMTAVAGVPPDYFNDQGQLWGMPVYDWTALAEDGYGWWVDRISKNLQFFDLLRLDHFRAFYDYWEVSPGEISAVNGRWQPGPGAPFFRLLADRLGRLPFIAEDLGEISPGVYQLRDALGLPGMNILQYAFGPDMPVSPYAPHNHKNHSLTYTGTHDNNTAIGWLRQEASKTERNNLEFYARTKLTENNIHEILAEVAYSSSADLAILPMQDILGLDESARLNTPGSAQHNWLWRLREHEPDSKQVSFLLRLAKRYNRQ